ARAGAAHGVHAPCAHAPGDAARRPRLAAPAGVASAGAAAAAGAAPGGGLAPAPVGMDAAPGARPRPPAPRGGRAARRPSLAPPCRRRAAPARAGALAVGGEPAGHRRTRLFHPPAPRRPRGAQRRRRRARRRTRRPRHRRHAEIAGARTVAEARMLQPTYPYYLANEARAPNADLEVRDKYSGDVAARVAQADAAAVDAAIAAAHAARAAMAAFPPDARRDVLEHCVRRFGERRDELALALCIEAGKPIRDARGEVERLIDTFRIAAGEATRVEGETVELQISPRARGYRGMVKRVPVGVCSFITPFNFPLNLVAHKVAPAIAAGCPFVLKPAAKTPVGALIIGEVLAETDLPKGAFSILPCRNEDASLLV